MISPTPQEIENTISWLPMPNERRMPLRPTPFTWSVLAPTWTAATQRAADVLKISCPALPLFQLADGQAMQSADALLVLPAEPVNQGVFSQLGLVRSNRLFDPMIADASETCARVSRWYNRVRQTRWGQAELLQVMEEIENEGIAILTHCEGLRLALDHATQEIVSVQREVWPDASAENVAALTRVVPAYDFALSQLKAGQLAEADFLAAHGHWAATETEFATPRWFENPTLLADALASQVVRVDFKQVHTNDALQTLSGRVGFLRRRGLESLVQTRERFAALRDAAEDARARWLAGTRIWALAAAQESLADQRLERADDIFFLELEEVKQLMTGEWNVTDRAHIHGLVAQRRSRA